MSTDAERDRFWKAIEVGSDRTTRLEDKFDKHMEALPAVIREAVQDAMPVALLTDEEYRAVQLMIRKQEQQLTFRNAVIEKSLGALVWAAIAGLGLLIKSYFDTHWGKP